MEVGNCEDIGIFPGNDFYLDNRYSLTCKYIDLIKRYKDWLKVNPEPSKWIEHKSKMNEITPEWYYWHFDKTDSFTFLIRNEMTAILKKFYAPKLETWNFLTLSPKPMLKMEDAEKFHNWVEKIMDPRFISSCNWVIECGKNEECPNIHAHILFKHINQGLSKNFKRDCSRSFHREFKCDINWRDSKGCGWKNVIIKNKNNPMYEKILKDKREYLTDYSKGALHKNFMDLGLNGGF